MHLESSLQENGRHRALQGRDESPVRLLRGGTGHDLAGSFLDCGELLVMQFVLLLLEVLGQIQFLLLDLFGGGRLIPCRPTEEHNTQYNIKRQSVPTESWRRECPARGCTRLSFISY